MVSVESLRRPFHREAQRVGVAGWATKPGLPLAAVEALVIAETACLLESSGVEWDPCAVPHLTRTAAGHQHTTHTAGGSVRIEVDVVPQASFAAATIYVPDPELFDRLADRLLEPPTTSADGIRLTTGQSHPISGNMTDALHAFLCALDRFHNRVRFEGPLTDENGTPYEMT